MQHIPSTIPSTTNERPAYGDYCCANDYVAGAGNNITVLKTALETGSLTPDLLDKVDEKDLHFIMNTMKQSGNKHCNDGSYEDATEAYTQVIVAAHHIYKKNARRNVGNDGTAATNSTILDSLKRVYANRSLVYIYQQQHDKALMDAECCIVLDPRWAKGHYRKGSSLLHTNKPMEAKACFETVLQLQPNNLQAKGQLDKCEMALNVLRQALGEQSKPINPESIKVQFNPTLLGKDFTPQQPWYTSSKSAKAIHTLLFQFSELINIHDAATHCMEFNKDVWLPVLQDNMVLLGTQLGRLPLLTDKTVKCVERYPMVARLVQGIYAKNRLLQKAASKDHPLNAQFKCELYNETTWFPSSVLFADWDYSVLGTGWLVAKKAYTGRPFFPQQIRVWVQFVHDDYATYDATHSKLNAVGAAKQHYPGILEKNWHSSIDKALPNDDLQVLNDKHYLDNIDTTGTYETRIDCFDKPVHGIRYGYDIVMPHGTFTICKEAAYQKYTAPQSTHQVLLYKVLPTRLVFIDNDVASATNTTGANGNGASVASASVASATSVTYRDNLPLFSLQITKDDHLNKQYSEAIQSLPTIPLTATSRGLNEPFSQMIAYQFPECSIVSNHDNPAVDLAVFDMFDAGLIGNGLLHRLKPLQCATTMLPRSATMYGQLVQCRSDVDDNGVDLTLTNPYRWMEDYQTTSGMETTPLGDPFTITVMDFKTIDATPQDFGQFTIPIAKDGIVSAVVFWFELDLITHTMDSRKSHHKAALQYLPEWTVKTNSTVDIQCKHDGCSFQFGICRNNDEKAAIATPRFDPRYVQQSTELQTKLSNIMQRLKYHPWEKKEVFTIACRLAVSAGRFNLNQSIAHKFVNNVMYV